MSHDQVDQPDTILKTKRKNFVYNENGHERRPCKFCNAVHLPRSEVVFFSQLAIIVVLIALSAVKLLLCQLECEEMSLDQYGRRKAIADGYLHLAHACNNVQHNTGRSFAHEHPALASSWTEDSTQAVVTLPGAYTALFDQCQFGLTSPRGTPLKKRTRILCNNVQLFNALHGCNCRPRSHEHCSIHGDTGWIPALDLE